MADIQYRVPWRAGSCYPGSHPGLQRGGGYEIHGIAPFYVAGDPRRFDVRASLRDPFGQLLVRVYKQRGTIPVHVLADVSASMSFVGRTCKFDLLRKFAASLAYSAGRVGDPFAFTACDERVREHLCLPATRFPGAAAALVERLRRFVPGGGSAAALRAGADRVSGARALVFLVSDYYLPLDLLRDVLGRLARHTVVPVVLVDTAEQRIPGAGVAYLADAESGRRRTLVLRPGLAERLQAAMRDHREQLRHCLAEFELRPLELVDRFEAEAVSRYFYE